MAAPSEADLGPESKRTWLDDVFVERLLRSVKYEEVQAGIDTVGRFVGLVPTAVYSSLRAFSPT
jgi:hypothetical protein